MTSTRPSVLSFILAISVLNLSVGHAAEVPEVIQELPITTTDRAHWSFRALLRPAVPKIAQDGWARTPVDRFVLAKLSARSLTPQPQAGRTTLIRRLYFDLLGIAPSPEQVDAFVADGSPNAYERLVDSLLAAPQYGERWAQHWLDVARFAETDGFEFDQVREEAWRYRDWVIDSLNADLPYSDFVRMQVAGDELDPGNEVARIPTSFCLSGPDMPDVNSQEERRHHVLNEVTSTVGSVLMGLQLGCAQCHDHKYDPISLADFYRLRAIFEPAVQLTKKVSLSTLRENSSTLAPSYIMLRGDWRLRGAEIAPGFPRIANLSGTQISSQAHANRSTENGTTENRSTERTSGRRSAFGNWLILPTHPLTARVIANRVWHYHFGDGLSRTPNDFGTVGDAPTHPELLDWLAVELVEGGWSLKRLQRAIVTSAVYRQASRPGDSEWPPEWSAAATASWKQSVAGDPANFCLARFPRQRLSGEAIRDAMLCAAGTLDSAQGGPGVRPPLPDEIVRTLLKNQWTVTPSRASHHRRSIYVFARRNLRYPLFEAFDRPDGNASCPRRSKSTTAPQSLLLLNSELSLELARHLAGRVLAEASGSLPEQVALAVRYAFNRQPTMAELASLRDFVEEQADLLRAERRSTEGMAAPLPCPTSVDPYRAAAWSDLCLALFNSSEFLYLD